MADLRISDLPVAVAVDDALDTVPMYDDSAGDTKQVTVGDLSTTITASLLAHRTATPIDHPALSVGTAALANLAVTSAKLGALAVTAGKIAADAVTVTEIANRNRSFWVVPSLRWDVTNTRGYSHMIDADPAATFSQYGSLMPDAVDTYVYGSFSMPLGLVSTMTVECIIDTCAGSAGAGHLDVYVAAGMVYGPISGSHNASSSTIALGAIAITDAADKLEAPRTLSPAVGVANAGNIVSVYFQRDATNGADTYDADIRFVGWFVTYLADS